MLLVINLQVLFGCYQIFHQHLFSVPQSSPGHHIAFRQQRFLKRKNKSRHIFCASFQYIWYVNNSWKRNSFPKRNQKRVFLKQTFGHVSIVVWFFLTESILYTSPITAPMYVNFKNLEIEYFNLILKKNLPKCSRTYLLKI